MKTIEEKTCKVDEELTIYKRIVKLEDGSNMYQLHVTTCKDFKVYMSSTFCSLESAQRIMQQI